MCGWTWPDHACKEGCSALNWLWCHGLHDRARQARDHGRQQACPGPQTLVVCHSRTRTQTPHDTPSTKHEPPATTPTCRRSKRQANGGGGRGSSRAAGGRGRGGGGGGTGGGDIEEEEEEGTPSQPSSYESPLQQLERRCVGMEAAACGTCLCVGWWRVDGGARVLHPSTVHTVLPCTQVATAHWGFTRVPLLLPPPLLGRRRKQKRREEARGGGGGAAVGARGQPQPQQLVQGRKRLRQAG